MVVLSLILTSCGLAIGATTAVAPELAEVATGAAQARAADAAPEPMHAPSVVVAPEPVAVPKPTRGVAEVGPMTHVWQSINNCGPAAVVMALSTMGVSASQEVARLALRGPDERRGMGPAPVDPWVQKEFGLRSMWRSNGTNALMKALVSNGFAPMVTQWLEDPWRSRIAHWRTVLGYDDTRGIFYANDPMLGARVALRYDWFGQNWQPFSYRYMVVYRPENEPLLRAIVGEDWSERHMRQRLYERARAEAQAQGTSAAWLAYGEAAYQYGMFEEAVAAFDKGLTLGSAVGVYTLRSSYPQALRALGRRPEAEEAQRRFASMAPVPATVAAAPDPFAVWLAVQRSIAFDSLRPLE